MAAFFVRSNTFGSSFKSISGAVSRKEASDFNRLSNQFDDRCCRLAETCVALEWKLFCFYYMCQFFVVLCNTRKFYLKTLLRYGERQFGKKKNNEKAAIKLAHTRASQTLEIVAACQSLWTKEHSNLKKDTGNYLSIKYCKLFASVALKRTLWLLGANFRRT